MEEGTKVQTPMYKINKLHRYTTQGIQPIFYNNYKWSITFKNEESLYCTPETYLVYLTSTIPQF